MTRVRHSHPIDPLHTHPPPKTTNPLPCTPHPRRPALPQNKHAAQRALLRNGDQLSTSCMVGVKPLDAAHRQAVEHGGGGGGGAGTSSASASSFAMAFPKPLQQQPRPYTLDAVGGGSGSSGAVVPLATKGITQRVKEFVLGW